MPKKKRAANHKGSIYRRKDGRWGFAYTDPSGKQITRTAKTEAEAVEKLNAVIANMSRGEYVDQSKMTVGTWLKIWVNEYAPNTAKASTVETYKTAIELHFLPEIGEIRLQALRPDHIQKLVNQQRKKYKPATIRRQLSILKRALGQAVENQLIIKNPASAVKLPKLEQKEVSFLSQEECEALLSVLPMTTSGRAIRFILGSGLRVSELCGLRWCDLEKDGFTVNQTLYIVNGKRFSEDEFDGKHIIATAPKTEAGRRYIPFNAKLLGIIKEQRAAQRVDRMTAGELWQGGKPGKGEQYIFSTRTGGPMDRHNVARALREYSDKAKIERRGPHALRHTFATRWIQSGKDPVTLSKILGHSNSNFTMRVYVHTDDTSKKQGMECMADLI